MRENMYVPAISKKTNLAPHPHFVELGAHVKMRMSLLILIALLSDQKRLC